MDATDTALSGLKQVGQGQSQPALEAYRALSEKLRRGGFAPGSRLPSERRLSEHLGVSRMTLRQVLQALADEGALQAVPQQGWFVPANAVLTEPANVLQSFTELAATRGLTATARMISSQIRPATLDEADRLRIAPTSPILQLQRLRALDGTPVCVDTGRVPLSRAKGLEDIDLSDTSLYQVLEERCGIRPTRAHFVVHARAADDELAALLDVGVGDPLLVGRETTIDQHEQPIVLGESTYRAEAYRFEATLFRAKTPEP